VRLAFALALLFLLPASTAAPSPHAAPRQVFFDDFTPARFNPLLGLWRHGWKIRTEQGWPGVRGASWSTANVSFVKDPASPRNRLLRSTSSTDGTAAGTSQTQLCQQRKFREGTWATRVRFGDAPASGPDGDVVVETFYAISPLEQPLDPDFSEFDWEYLPNGGWGREGPTLWTTTWETARLEPWLADNVTLPTSGSMAGWHVLVTQVSAGTVTYFLDGARRVAHSGKYYPEVPMSLNYNVWFVDGGLVPSRTRRAYVQDVDWAFGVAGEALEPQQVLAQVRALRAKRVAFRDSVAAAQPPLESPCNL
jgi:hypothetical protein